MVRGWGTPQSLGTHTPVPALWSRAQGGLLRECRRGKASFVSVSVVPKEPLSLQFTLGWGGPDLSPSRGCWGMPSPKEQQVFSESL